MITICPDLILDIQSRTQENQTHEDPPSRTLSDSFARRARNTCQVARLHHLTFASLHGNITPTSRDKIADNAPLIPQPLMNRSHKQSKARPAVHLDQVDAAL